MITERRLLREEPDFGLLTKLWRINWLFVVLLCLPGGQRVCGVVLGRRRAGALCVPARAAVRVLAGDDAVAGDDRHTVHRAVFLAALWGIAGAARAWC